VKLYVIISADGYVYDIQTKLKDTRVAVRGASGALQGCTVAEYRVPQDLANIRALFFHTFGRFVPVRATVLRTWWVSKRGGLRPLPIEDYEGTHDRLQRRVLGAAKAPRRHVESYFDPRLAGSDEVLRVDSSYGDTDGDFVEQAGEIDVGAGEDPTVSAGTQTPSDGGADRTALPAQHEHREAGVE
jgi:hypothetical protein